MSSVDIVITGIGLRSCLGNLNNSWEQILLNNSGIASAQPFLHLPPYPLGLIGEKPAHLQQLTQEIVQEAILDAQLELPQPDCAVVIGSSRGAQAQWEQMLTNRDAKINWWESLPQIASVITAQQLNTQAPVLAPMAACATGIWAIAQGYELIQRGYCHRVIAGAIETPITPLTLVGFEQMNALAKTGCYPFARQREGLVLGEGGAVFILEDINIAKSRQAKIYGRILGFSLSCDGEHISAPEATGKYAIAALEKCFQRNHLSPQDFDYIHAHGTGTKLNDLREAKIITSLFGANIAVSSTKGATGHTLGASGALGTAFCLMALQRQQLPPCVGLSETEFDLNLITNTSQSKINKVLCFSFGFGGQNAAIALGC